MRYEFANLINDCDEENRALLARVLSTSNNSPLNLMKQVKSQGQNLWEKIFRDSFSYEELLVKVASAHGVNRRVLECDEDFELRLVRTAYKRAIKEVSLKVDRSGSDLVDEEPTTFKREGVGALALLGAQWSGFGVYQMATTLLGAASAVAGITVPFIGYMALTKGISLAIGPLGWVALGISSLHKITKPKYAELVAVVAWACLVRGILQPRRLIKGYSLTELFRKALKIAVPTAGIVFLAAAVLGLPSREQKDNGKPIYVAGIPLPTTHAAQQPDYIKSPVVDSNVPSVSLGDRAEGNERSELRSESTEDESDEEAADRALSVWREGVLSNDMEIELSSYAPTLDRFFLLHPATKNQVLTSLEQDRASGVTNETLDISNLKTTRETDGAYLFEFDEHYIGRRHGITRIADVKTEIRFANVEGKWLITHLRQFQINAPIERY